MWSLLLIVVAIAHSQFKMVVGRGSVDSDLSDDRVRLFESDLQA